MSARILKGPERPLPKLKLSLGEQFIETANKFADEPFQIDACTGQQETWSQILQRATHVAIWLRNNGIYQASDTIASCFPCNFISGIPVLSSFLIGTRFCPFDPSQDLNDIEYLLTLIEPTVIFLDYNSLELFENALKDIKEKPKIVVAGLIGDCPNGYIKLEDILDMPIKEKEIANFQPAQRNPQHIPLLFCTSGTTGQPKIVCMPAQSFASEGHESFAVLKFIHLNTYYWTTTIAILNYQIFSGSAVIRAPKVTIKQYVHALHKYKILNVVITPMILADMMQLTDDELKSLDFSNTDTVNIIGHVVYPFQISFLKRYFPNAKITNDYGSTECFGVVVSFNYSDTDLRSERKLNSCGLPMENVQIKIVDPDTKEILPPHVEGEILVKTPKAMSGYLKTPYNETFYKNGFFTIGDYGYYDDDGFIYVKDRISASFNYRAYRIYPLNIEGVLLKHPQVREAIVFGVLNYQDKHRPAACVVLKENATVNADELINYVARNVSDHNRLRSGLKIFKSLPKTPSGKIQRRKIVEWFENAE